MSEELRPCPFCGGEAELCYSEHLTFCRKCNVMQETELWNTRPIEDELQKRIAELEAERDQAKAAITRLRDYLYDYTNLHISVRQEDRWWALVDKFDELTKELQS